MNKQNEVKMQFSEGIEKIREQILDPKIKVVSFDIFDTLLFRPVLNPTDIFRLLENKLNIPNFHNMRITAEVEARRYKSLYVQDITLEDIYDTYAKLFSITEKETKKLMQEELKIESKLLYERKSAKYLYEQALNAGKEVIIISDMYLSSEFLNECLKKNGYQKHLKIYVSSETGVSKASKDMYRFVISDIEKNNILPSEILHIGDNKKADIDNALALGMNAAFLPKPADIRKQCSQFKKIYTYIIEDIFNSHNSLLYGVLMNKYFDDPFCEFDKNSYFNGEAKFLGYWLSPLMVSLGKWLIECIENKHIEQLLWVWRDGYLPAKILEILRPLFTDRDIDIDIIYLSRSLRIPYLAFDKNGFFSSFVEYPLKSDTSVDFFIKNRLYCNNREEYKAILDIFYKHGYVNENSMIGEFGKYRGFLHELEPYFIKNATKKIKRYSKYIDSKINKNKKIAVFDRSLRGSHSRFLKKYFDIDTLCLTTEVYDVPNSKLEDINIPFDAYLEYGAYLINRMSGIWVRFFERIISDTAPGFNDIIENTDGSISVELETPPINNRDSHLESESIIRIVQESIIEFTRECANIFGEYYQYLNIDKHGILDYTVEILINPYIKDAELIMKISPDKSNVVPVNENAFIQWFNVKFKKNIKPMPKTNTSLHERIRVKGYVISEQLGILNQTRAIYRFIVHKPQEPMVSISLKTIQEQTNLYIERLKKVKCENLDILLIGSIPAGKSIFFNYLSRTHPELKIMFNAVGALRVPTCFDFPCIEGPEIFNFWWIEGAEKKINIPLEIKEKVNSKQYLKDVVERRVLKGYSRNIAILLAYEGDRYYHELLKILAPRMVMVWNNCGNNSSIPLEIAKKYNIPALSAESGFLEGTIMLSKEGYGKDKINQKPENFCSLNINQEELKNSEEIIAYLQESSLNRYTQPINKKLDEIKKKINNGKANIVIIGSFDCENPGFPDNKTIKNYYSPIFNTSKQVVFEISKLAKKNQWNVIFKPHPLMEKMIHSKEGQHIPHNVIYIREANINELVDMADVVVCMISGVSYITLIREKPLVQLAYTPLKGKNCCYEAYSIDAIEETIKAALEKRFTEEQKKAFIQHVAQVNKYYYFDDLTVRPIRYGRSIEEAAQLLKNMINENNEGDN